MTLLTRHPEIVEALISLAILTGSYLGARLFSYLSAGMLRRAARHTGTSLDDRLIATLEWPLTYALFLAGAYVAVHRLPIPERVSGRLDGALFVFGVLLLTLALLRSLGIAVTWYTTRPHAVEGPAREFGPLVGKLGRIFIILLALIAILQHFGVNVSSLVVSLGVGSLAIGLAAQDTLSNMFAGFILMLDRPFRIGERIKLASGEVGDVEMIGMRATRIRTLDDTMLIVPNSALVKDRVVNQSRPSRHITSRLEVAVAYGTDLAKAKRILAEAALASQYVASDRPPVVLVKRFADFSIELQLLFWAKDYADQGPAVSEVHEEIDRRFREEGIEIPFPIRKLIQEVAVAAPEKRSDS